MKRCTCKTQGLINPQNTMKSYQNYITNYPLVFRDYLLSRRTSSWSYRYVSPIRTKLQRHNKTAKETWPYTTDNDRGNGTKDTKFCCKSYLAKSSLQQNNFYSTLQIKPKPLIPTDVFAWLKSLKQYFVSNKTKHM